MWKALFDKEHLCGTETAIYTARTAELCIGMVDLISVLLYEISCCVSTDFFDMVFDPVLMKSNQTFGFLNLYCTKCPDLYADQSKKQNSQYIFMRTDPPRVGRKYRTPTGDF